MLLKPYEEISKITLVAGVAVCRAINFLNPELKWPNDVYINNEMFGEDPLEKATSLFLETGIKYDIKAIIKEVLNELEDMYSKMPFKQ